MTRDEMLKEIRTNLGHKYYNDIEKNDNEVYIDYLNFIVEKETYLELNKFEK